MPKKSPAAAKAPRARGAREAPGAVWAAAALLAALLPWAVWPGGGTRDPYSDLKWPLAFAGIVALAATALARGREGERGKAPGGLLFCAGAGLIAAGLILSSAFSEAPRLGFKVSIREIAFVAAAVLLAGQAAKGADARVFVGAYLVSAALQAGLVIAQWSAGEGARLTGRAAMIGTFGNPEHAAGWLAPAMAAAVVWFAHAPKKALPRAALGAAALILAAALVLGAGRGAALGASAGVAAALGAGASGAKNRMRGAAAKLIAPAAAAALLVALAIGAAVFLGPEARRQCLAARMTEMFDPHSISVRHRIGLVAVTSRMIAENPILGAGPGRFAAEFDRTRGRIAEESEELGPWAFNELLGDQSANEAHCDPLQWQAEYGLAPFLGLIVMISCGLAALARVVRLGDGGNGGGPAAVLILAILATLTVGMLFSFPLHRPGRATLFWISLGLGMAIARGSGGKAADEVE